MTKSVINCRFPQHHCYLKTGNKLARCTISRWHGAIIAVQCLLDRPIYAPASHTLWSSAHNVFCRQPLAIFSSEYYQVLIASHLPTPEG